MSAASVARAVASSFGLLTLTLGLALPSRAASPPDAPLVVIRGVHDAAASAADETDGAAVRLAAELSALGLRARLAPELSADAAADVLLDVAHGRVEVTFFEVGPAGSARQTLRQVLEASPAADVSALLVVRTVELVRAVLLPTAAETARVEARPPVGVAAPTSPELTATAPGPRPRSRVAVALTSGALFAPNGAGAAATLSLAARLRVVGPLGVELSAFAPLSGREYSTLEGRSDATTWLAGLGVFARSAPRRLGVDGGVGALALWLRTDGTPSPGFAATGASVVSAAGYARLGVALTLGPQLAARVDLHAGALARRPVVAFPDSGERVAWGRGFVGALAGLEARWF